jgi:hypothetical protein
VFRFVLLLGGSASMLAGATRWTRRWSQHSNGDRSGPLCSRAGWMMSRARRATGDLGDLVRGAFHRRTVPVAQRG